jgi:hypothetical protein
MSVTLAKTGFDLPPQQSISDAFELNGENESASRTIDFI